MTLQAIFEKLEYIESLLVGKQPERFLTTREVTHLTGLSDSTIRRSVRSGRLKVNKSTGKLIFSESDIQKWLSSK